MKWLKRVLQNWLEIEPRKSVVNNFVVDATRLAADDKTWGQVALAVGREARRSMARTSG